MQVRISLLLLILGSLSLAGNFDLDYAVFRGDQENDVVEVYLMIPRILFDFVENDGGYSSSAFVRIAFVRDDTVRQMQEWSFMDRVDDPKNVRDTQKIPEIATLNVPKGKYRIIAIIMDMNSKKTYREEKDIYVKEFAADKLTLSDIQLSNQITRTDTKNKFSKYFNYDIIPNAGNVYGEQNPTLYAFCEIYNLDTSPNSSDKYQVNYAIVDLNDNIIQDEGWLKKQKPGHSAVEIKGINITNLNSGIYNFKITVREENTESESVAYKRFYIVKNDHKKLIASAMNEDDLSAMSEKELNERFGPLKYFATDKERRIFRKSNEEGKRNIIKHFWDNRDPDPTTPVNEAEFEYQQRLKYVTEQFTTQQRKGWQSDMGRIYLIYGKPSEIERFPSSLETKPYQIWHYYEVEGGVYFVFVDKSGFGMMELVHSTARNELQDSEWQRWIKPTRSSPGSYY